MSILALTIDYGPYGFLDAFDPHFICNHSDHKGRYAFNQQPFIGLWNLNALAHSLSSLLPEAKLRQALEQYQGVFAAHFETLMNAKLGLKQTLPENASLQTDLLALPATEAIDYSAFFRALSHQEKDHSLNDSLQTLTHSSQAIADWYKLYQQRLAKEENSFAQQQAIMLAHKPKYILRNFLAQWAIDDAEKGDYQTLNDLLQALQNPFNEQPEFERFAKLPPDWAKKISVSCSS